jgi:hypothetical protein
MHGLEIIIAMNYRRADGSVDWEQYRKDTAKERKDLGERVFEQAAHKDSGMKPGNDLSRRKRVFRQSLMNTRRA